MKWLRWLLVVTATCAIVSPGFAQQPTKFSACLLVVDTPSVNADNTPLTDLAGVRFLASSVAQGPYDVVVADIPTMQIDQTVTVECVFPSEQQWFVVAVAYDDAQPENVSAPSNELSLIWDRTVPGSMVLTVTVGVSVTVQVSQ